jgi:hypothetical protein
MYATCCIRAILSSLVAPYTVTDAAHLPCCAAAALVGGDCAKYGDNNCNDVAFVGYVCPEDFECKKGVMEDKKTPNKWYWQCVKAEEDTTPPPADDDDEEEEEPAADIVLKEWEQCGGAGRC